MAMVLSVHEAAREIYRLYHDHMFSEIGLLATNRHKTVPSIKKQPLSVHMQFIAAAESCLSVDANPKAYVVAQFKAFAEYSQFFKKRMFPQPTQLAGLGAQARYLKYKAQQEDSAARKPTDDQKQVKTFYREERRLKGLSRMLRLTPEEVLTSRPKEFSKEFLQTQNVWPLVRRQYV